MSMSSSVKEELKCLRDLSKSQKTTRKPGKALRTQRACTYLDRLTDEDVQRRMENEETQKDLIKRLEKSEWRILYGDHDETEYDLEYDPDAQRVIKTKCKRNQPKFIPPLPLLPCDDPCDPWEPCEPCVKEKTFADIVTEDEVNRKKFIKKLKQAQDEFEINSRKARMRYEKRIAKCQKKCDKIWKILNKVAGTKEKVVKITQGKDAYKVFIHTDPGHCGCTDVEPETRKDQLLRKVYKYGCIAYVVAAILGGLFYYLINYKPFKNNDGY